MLLHVKYKLQIVIQEKIRYHTYLFAVQFLLTSLLGIGTQLNVNVICLNFDGQCITPIASHACSVQLLQENLYNLLFK